MLTLSQFAVNVITLLGILIGTALCTAALVVSAMQAAYEADRAPIPMDSGTRTIPRITTATGRSATVFDIDFGDDGVFAGFCVRQLRGGSVVARTPCLYTEDEALSVAVRLNGLAAA